MRKIMKECCEGGRKRKKTKAWMKKESKVNRKEENELVW
jgi:hypothetical protein